MPIHAHVIVHPESHVLVDTGMTKLHPVWPTSLSLQGRVNVTCVTPLGEEVDSTW